MGTRVSALGETDPTFSTDEALPFGLYIPVGAFFAIELTADNIAFSVALLVVDVPAAEGASEGAP